MIETNIAINILILIFKFFDSMKYVWTYIILSTNKITEHETNYRCNNIFISD